MVRRSKLPKLKKGMQSEQIAILYLIEKGFFVFKNFFASETDDTGIISFIP